MTDHALYMEYCLELARKGAGSVAPNPMVGSVIVRNGEVIGQGYHEIYGGPHAEVNAVISVVDQELLKDSTLYVSLEPCSHFGKTPPCADLIIEKKIPKVVVASLDPNPEVAGKGIEKLKAAGIEVISGTCEKEAKWLNRRFMTFHKLERPYIILKWAETADGFIDRKRDLSEKGKQEVISSPESLVLSHKWRSEEMAILVGAKTALLDDPELTTRLSPGKNPVRMLIDPDRVVPDGYRIFSDAAPTVVFTDVKGTNRNEIPVLIHDNIIESVVTWCVKKNILSLIVEGGSKTHACFIECGTWDEIRVITANKTLGSGVRSQSVPASAILYNEHFSGEDKVRYYSNPLFTL